MMNTVEAEKTLTTADLAAGAQRREATEEPRPAERDAARSAPAAEQLAALFAPETADDFRSRWDSVQIGFVDDPRKAVQQADELVAQVMKNLAGKFADERQGFEAQMTSGEAGAASTENLRVALRNYRSFFQRLLSL